MALRRKNDIISIELVKITVEMTRRAGDVVISEASIRSRLSELAAELDADYAGRDLLLLGVLSNSVMLMADLSRLLRNDRVEIAWIEAAAFSHVNSASGVIRARPQADLCLSGKNVVVIDCMALSWLTLDWTLAYVRYFRVASATALVLACGRGLLAPCAPARYVGFTVPAGPLAGYGVDYLGRYRNLPYIARLVPAEETSREKTALAYS
jgi:hypoxanthine phosphoribosyltransferase